MELVKGLGLEIQQVRISGGGARSELWRQILADVFGVELAIINVTEGAALLAGVGTGIYKNVREACDAAIKVLQCIAPNQEHVLIYNEYYSLYSSLYAVLKPSFDQLAKMLTKHTW